MAKHLTKHGNSLALVIEKPILDLLKTDDQTPLELATDGDLLIVKPCRDGANDEKLREIHGRVGKRYGKVFKRLTD
jgi:antitoxin component of MazEF toxin-antitoxin module